MMNTKPRTQLPPEAVSKTVKPRERSHLPGRRAVISALALMVLAPTTAVLPGVKTATAQSCLSASSTRQAISNGDVISLSQVQSILRGRGYSEISSADVCQSGGRYVYTVIASTASGASARITIDGASGSILSVQ